MDDISSFDPDAFLASANAGSTGTPQGTPAPTDGFNPDEFLKDAKEEQYGTPGQMLKTAAEGAAEGIAGPLAPLAETSLGIAKPEDVLARHEVNPVTHGVGQAVGLGAGLLTGTGEAALMTGAGKLALEGAGLAHAAEGASLGFRVGSAAVQQAAEMAVLQGSDETSKLILNDPNTSAETAIANIGLSAALGGAGGAFMTGAVSPLWNATVGPSVEKGLAGLASHIDGSGLNMANSAKEAVTTLGMDESLTPLEKAFVSGDQRLFETGTKLRYAQNKEAMDAVQSVEHKVSDAAMNALNVPLEDAQVFSQADLGHNAQEALGKEIRAKYGPIAEKYEAKEAINKTIGVADDARLDRYGKLQEMSLQADPEHYELYNKWGNKLIEKENIAGVDDVLSKLNNDIRDTFRQGNTNKRIELQKIRDSIKDFRESEILSQSAKLEAEGAEFGSAIGKDIVKEQQALSKEYAEYAKMHSDLLEHIGNDKFKGTETMLKRLESMSPEDFLKKFSPKNNADILPFMQKYFPETLEKVRQNELLQAIKPAINSAKGEMPININRLDKILTNLKAGKAEYANFILPPDAQAKIQAAKTLMEHIPTPRDSGTPGGLMKLLRDVPRNALGVLGMMMGHNPITSAIMGEMAGFLSKEAPESVRLAYMKFLGSNQPIKAEGFKAMVDFFHATAKGETLMAKASHAIFKSGAEVLSTNLIPDDKDRSKLDKQVGKFQDNPESRLNAQNGHTGHYLPQHQAALAESSTRAVQYLAGLKPHPVQLSPLDHPIEPSKAEVARYHRALDIAQQPAIVLQHIKDGTLLPSDIQDLNGMYPGVYKSMVGKLTNAMTSRHADDGPIPYKTRIGVSLFMGQPMDSTMVPTSIVAAQPVPTPPMQQQGAKGQPKSSNALKKLPKSYMTQSQSSESDRASRRD